MNLVDLVLPGDLEQLNEYSHILVKEFPKLDMVAELALRKFKARGAAGGGASGQVPLTADTTTSTVLMRAGSPAKGSQERLMSQESKDLLPSQQLDKFIATTLNTSNRKNKGKLITQRKPAIAVTSGSMHLAPGTGNVILGLQMPPSQTMYNNAFSNLRSNNLNSRQKLKQDCLSNFTDDLLS